MYHIVGIQNNKKSNGTLIPFSTLEGMSENGRIFMELIYTSNEMTYLTNACKKGTTIHQDATLFV
jgi:hypothetical protein